MSECLILIDFEEEWRDKTSEYFLGNLNDTINSARKLLMAFRDAKKEVIFTRHVEPDSSNAFKDLTKNTEIVHELIVEDGDKVITKNKISPFYRTDLDAYLKEKDISHIYVCGIMTNLCVRSTVSDAYDRDLEITVVKDACASDSEETDEFTFRDLKATRPEINILTSSEAIKQIRENNS